MYNAGRFLRSRIGRLLGDEAMSDIKFLVGEDLVEFPAHKLIFGASSDEFFNGFYAMTPADNIIKLPEIKVESFKEFLSYIYTEEANVNPENILDIMKLGDRYGIKHLMVFCFDNAVDFIDDQLHLFDDLLNFCKFAENDFLDMIAKDPLKYLTADNVEKLKKECLKVILKAEETKASETQLYDLAVLWARQKTSADNPMQIRAFLGDLILLIRFPTMTAIEFETCIQKHPGILDSQDVIEILLYISKQSGNCKYPVEKRKNISLRQLMVQQLMVQPKTKTSTVYGSGIYTHEFFISESSFGKPVRTNGGQPLYFSVRAACALKSISYYVNGKLDKIVDLHVIVRVCGPHVTGTIQEMFLKYDNPIRFQRKSIELCSIDLKENVLLEPKETYSIQLKLYCKTGTTEQEAQKANKKFQQIVVTLPKMVRDGNIILSCFPKHKDCNEGSSVSSICYKLE